MLAADEITGFALAIKCCRRRLCTHYQLSLPITSYLTALSLLPSPAPKQGHQPQHICPARTRIYGLSLLGTHRDHSQTGMNECVSKETSEDLQLRLVVCKLSEAQRDPSSLFYFILKSWQPTFCFIFVQLQARRGAGSPFVFALRLLQAKSLLNPCCYLW